MIKVSCIVPVYNAQDYLFRSIYSLINQSLKEIEIILVNDGSTDESLTIMQKLQESDHRIKILSQNNSGSSISRNVGIAHCVGKYIFFLDVDDSIELKTLELLYNKAEKDKLDILIFDYQKIYANNSSSIKTRNMSENQIYSSHKEKHEILSSSGVVVWNKLYLASLIKNNDIRFVPEIYYEDIPFFWSVMIQAKAIGYLKATLYNYYQVKNSIMNTSYTFNKSKHLLIAMLETKKTLEKHGVYNIYKQLFEIKIIKTFISFFHKTKDSKQQLFFLMTENLSFIDIKEHRNKISVFRYFKYKIFLKGNYHLYRILFSW